MPITTHIVIPQLLSHTNYLQQPISPESFSLSTPPKLTKSASQLSWKKKQSAFKKFRDRNAQKQESVPQSQSQRENRSEERPKMFFRLTRKSGPIQQMSLNREPQRRIQEPTCYYDPNLAPLYGEGLCQAISNQLTTTDLSLCRSVSKSTPKIQQEKLQNKCLKIESLPTKRLSQTVAPQMQIERTDDPFIIVRSSSPQKNKTKFIRKQKQKTPAPIRQQNNNKISSDSNILPGNTLRTPIELSHQPEEVLEVVEVELSYPSESQSEMDLQQQKYISCD